MANTGHKPRLSIKAKIELSRRICNLYSQGKYTIATCCETFQVKYTTFQQWVQINLTPKDIQTGNVRRGYAHEVHVMYKEALENNEINYKVLLKNAVRHGLIQRVSGTTVEEVQTVVTYDLDGNSTGMNIKKIKKVVLPDATV